MRAGVAHRLSKLADSAARPRSASHVTPGDAAMAGWLWASVIGVVLSASLALEPPPPAGEQAMPYGYLTAHWRRAAVGTADALGVTVFRQRAMQVCLAERRERRQGRRPKP